MNLKFVFLGGPGVGKSSIVKAYTQQTEEVMPTLTAAFFQQQLDVDGNTYNLGIWDTAGAEQYRSIAPIYFRNTVVAFIVVDATNENSDDDANFWLTELSSKCDNDVVIITVMNKIDLQPINANIKHRINQLASRWNSPSFYTSATKDTGIRELFEYAISAGIEQLHIRSRAPTEKANLPVQNDEKSSGCC